MATRLYFSASTVPDITPDFDGSWSETDNALRRVLNDVKGSSAITTGTRHAFTSQNYQLDRQYISSAITPGTVFTSGSHTVKGQLMVREYANTDNVDQLVMNIRIVSSDGGTVRATILTGNTYGAIAEFVNNATHRNKQLANGDALTGSYTTVAGDRLVIEIGYRNSAAGTTPEASAKWGGKRNRSSRK